MIRAIMRKLFRLELKVLMDKYRGYGIQFIGGGFQLYLDDQLIETHQTADDDNIKLQKARNAIDSKYREIRKDVDANIQRVDAQVKMARDNGC